MTPQFSNKQISSFRKSISGSSTAAFTRPDAARDKKQWLVIHKIVVDSDHVHLFVSLPLWMSVSLALQYLKGISAYKMFRLHPEFREELFRKGSFWSPGHFSRSVSNITSATVERYIDKHEYPKYTSVGDGRQTKMGRFM